jgi:molybdopterin/thiamine biosynthesis adenylyltransferase/proteasome lid subunit RPN8/RPN11
MTVTLVTPAPLAQQLAEAIDSSVETAAVILAGLIEGPDGDLRLLAREVHMVSDEAYMRRGAHEMLIASDGYMRALARAEQTNSTPIWFHTHPGTEASPYPSARDRLVDTQIADLFRQRSATRRYATMILAGTRELQRFTGHVDHHGRTVAIARMWRPGPRFALLYAADQPRTRSDSDLYDRNIRAFGGPLQNTLAALKIGVVGAGGTGSAVAEQLARLGAGNLTLIDPDVLSRSNTTRVYGSTVNDVGRPKTEVLARHLTRIAPTITVRSIQGTITNERTARELSGCDLVFGCTDDNAGRLVLSRLATYLLTPVIDVGVLLSSDSTGRLTGIDGRVTVLTPGSACLVCRDRVDLARAQAELMPPEEHQRLEKEGYAAALPGVEPAVITYTTMVAAAATSELLERLISYGPDPEPGELLLRLHDREISTNTQAPRPGHYCDPDSGNAGVGDGDPFLGQTWAA